MSFTGLCFLLNVDGQLTTAGANPSLLDLAIPSIPVTFKHKLSIINAQFAKKGKTSISSLWSVSSLFYPFLTFWSNLFPSEKWSRSSVLRRKMRSRLRSKIQEMRLTCIFPSHSALLPEILHFRYLRPNWFNSVIGRHDLLVKEAT